MSHGFHNRILRVNLTTSEISVEEPGEIFFRTYLGGWGKATGAPTAAKLHELGVGWGLL